MRGFETTRRGAAPRLRPTATVVATAAVLLWPAQAGAGGFEVPDQSSVAGATGGAGAGRRGDPASAWYNPAESADGRGLRLGLGVLLAIPSITAEGLEEPMETAATQPALSTPPHLHLSYSRRFWAIGTYVGLSHGSTVRWPEGWWGRFESMETGIMGLRAAPFFALRLGGEGGLCARCPDLRFSLGAHLDALRFESRRDLDFVEEQGSLQLLLSGIGAGGDASLYWQATRRLGVAFTYHSRTVLKLEGDADFTVPETFVGRARDQHATTELTIPDRLSLGAAWQQPSFGIFLELDLTLWSVRDRLQVDFEEEATSDVDSPTSWHDSLEVRLGGEYSPLPWLHGRLGFFYDMQVGPQDTLAPSSPDMVRLGATVGLGVDVGRAFGADVYYAYVAMLQRDSTGPDAALTRYSGQIHLVGLTLRLGLRAGSGDDRAASSAPAEVPAEDAAPVPAPPPPAPSGEEVIDA